MAQSYHDLLVWQKAIDLTLCIYKLTRSFPNSELYGLTSQMRRATVSVASNIAEGRGRLNPAEFRQFLGLAQGSLFELRTQLLVTRKLGFASGESFKEADLLSEEVSKMLRTFIQRLTVPPRTGRLASHLSRIEIEANG
jgi:four helix bundle protein